MFSVVIVGNSNTYIENNKMITPRGYRGMIQTLEELRIVEVFGKNFDS